jgi:hypothetical protein
MAVPNRNDELQKKKIQLFIELPYIRLNNLKFVEYWQEIL